MTMNPKAAHVFSARRTAMRRHRPCRARSGPAAGRGALLFEIGSIEQDRALIFLRRRAARTGLAA